MSAAFWICAGVTLISSLVSAGYAVAGVRSAPPESRAPSMYALARSAALVVVAIIGLFTASIAFVAAVAVAMVLVQGLDAVIGVVTSDRVKTFGPAITAAVNAAALVWMLAS
jgi:hypothetical protein